MSSRYRPEIVQSAFVDFIGSRLQPFWSLTVPRLRLIARYALSHELVALQFEVNQAFKQQVFKPFMRDALAGWQGGQHINISVPIDGINHQRSYSLVGLPKQDLWWEDDDHNIHDSHNSSLQNAQPKKQRRQTVTIAIKPQGLVSNYLTCHALLGTIFDTSVPSGDFTLQQTAIGDIPTSTQSPLLFIAGGSGITPMLGLITQALQARRQVTLLHYSRAPVLVSFWQDLATSYPQFTYHLVNTQDPETYLAGSRHLTVQSLLSLALPLAETQIFACGSQALLASLYQSIDAIDAIKDANRQDNGTSLRDNIKIESFGTALSALEIVDHVDAADEGAYNVYLRQRQRQFLGDSTILHAAEQVGIRMTHGCRQGICHMCRCNKVSGVVKNIQTGKVSSDGFESIQTCITIPITDVVLDV